MAKCVHWRLVTTSFWEREAVCCSHIHGHHLASCVWGYLLYSRKGLNNCGPAGTCDQCCQPVTAGCPRLSRSVLSLLEFTHKENVFSCVSTVKCLLQHCTEHMDCSRTRSPLQLPAPPPSWSAPSGLDWPAPLSGKPTAFIVMFSRSPLDSDLLGISHIVLSMQHLGHSGSSHVDSLWVTT
jgi:hypothetical protein